MEALINYVLLSMLALIALGIICIQGLFSAVMLASVFSLACALLFVTLDAVDVAFTEAAVGAGISTVLMLATLSLTGRPATTTIKHLQLPLVVVVATGAALIYGTLDMPPCGDPQAPAHTHVAPRYIQDSPNEVGIPNMVTSVLASYRGYDTLGEVAAIFSAGVGVWMVLGG